MMEGLRRLGRGAYGVGPGSPLEGDGLAGFNGGRKRGRGAAGVLPAVALDIDGGDILDGAVAWDLADDARRRGGVVRVGVGLVSGVGLAGDGEGVDVTVGGDGGGEGAEDGEDGEGPHDEVSASA